MSRGMLGSRGAARRSGRILAAFAGAVGLSLCGAFGASAQEPVKIGFLATFSGPGAILGQELYDGFMLAVEQKGGKLGGLPVEILKVDDELKPDVGVQHVKRLIERDKVPIVTGVVFSNVMMAIHKPLVDSKTIMVSGNAGPSPIAGKQCAPTFFATSWQNDQMHSVAGAYLQKKGVKNVMVLAPNYQAGKDAVAGFKRFFQGNVVDEVYVPVNQIDFSGEIARISSAKPDAVFAFFPGGMGVAFLKQYDQFGVRKTVPLYSAFTVDHVTLRAVGESAVGTMTPQFWAPDFDNPANKKFVEAYKAKYNRLPAMYAVQGYDAAQLIDSALAEAKGTTDRDALAAVMRKANFQSPRGAFKFGVNNFPVQDFYMGEVVKAADGTIDIATRERVLSSDVDPYAAECKP
jgi:branched-chain amino acid transport system substrate-binding protein